MKRASLFGLAVAASFSACSHHHEHRYGGWMPGEQDEYMAAWAAAYPGAMSGGPISLADPATLLLDSAMSLEAEEHAGFLLGSPVGVTSNQGAGVTIKMAGFKSIPPPDASGEPPPNPPAFELFPGVLFPASLASVLSSQPPVLAMSLGTDVIQVAEYDGALTDYSETAMVPPNYAILEPMPGMGNWAAIEFSVNHDEINADGSSHPIAAAIADAGEERVDRTVFSFLIPGEMPALAVEYESVSAMGPESLGLGTGAQIHALNMQMALYHTDLSDPAQANVFTLRGLVPDPWIYFTLRGAFLMALQRSQVTVPWLTHADSGTIYRTHWDPASGSWGVPEVFRTWQDLTGQMQPATIDGLSIDVDAVLGRTEILFSTGASTPTEDQIRYVWTKGDGSKGKVRRVVVYKRDGGGYGSLGVMLGGRCGIGDFCTKDPGIEAQKYVHSFRPLHPDELFVARRLMPRGIYTEIGKFDHSSLASHLGLVPFLAVEPAQPEMTAAWPGPHGLGWPGIGRGSPIMIPMPQLALAVSGYRQNLKTAGGAARPNMRTCMSWPEPHARFGRAYVEWGRADNVFNAASIDWEDPMLQAYNRGFIYFGRALSWSCPLPTANPDPNSLRAVAARWRIEAGGRTYISHISVLRY